MQPYPHIYTVQASGMATGSVPISATRLPTLETGPPAEFDGPGDLWSPESLLVAAIADCFILTFRGVSRAAALTLAAGADHAKFHALLERAENVCLVANSLRGERTLEVRLIETAAT
jgi:organic hydroperoxide reductase OsmC/OhrA